MAAQLTSLLSRLFITHPDPSTYPPYPVKKEVHKKEKNKLTQALLTPTTSKKLESLDLIRQFDPYLHSIIKAFYYDFELLAKSSEHLSTCLSYSFNKPQLVDILEQFSQPTYNTPIHLTLKYPNKEHFDAIVKKFPTLESLSFEGNRISDDDFLHTLKAADSVATLKLQECGKLTETSFKSLPQFCNAQAVEIIKSDQFSDTALAAMLASCRKLVHLSVTKCKQLAFRSVYGKYQLETVVIDECPIRAIGLIAISEVFLSLRTFTLRSCPSITKEDFQVLELPPTVTKLELSTLSIPNEELQRILEKIPVLFSLSVSNLSITDAELQFINSRYCTLEHLDVSHCEQLTPRSFTGFPQTLTTFDATNTSFDLMGIKRLLRFCPKISTVGTENCDQLPAIGKKVTKEKLQQIAKTPTFAPTTIPQAQQLQFDIDV